MRSNPLAAVVALIIAIVLAVMLIDCTAGRWVYYRGSITSHRYVPENRHSHTDDDGNTTWHTDPEEFHLGFLSDDGQSLDLSVSRDRYNETRDDQQVWVKARRGKLGHYLCHIVDEPPTAEQ